MTTAERQTARRGDPQNASRGAAVTRAKRELGDAIDALRNINIERMEFELLVEVIGCSLEEVEARLNTATLGELKEWIANINDRSESKPGSDISNGSSKRCM